MDITCADCDAPQHARGLCQQHYDKRRRAGLLANSTTTRADCTIRDVEGNKICVRCREWKPASRFSRNKSRKDGLQAYCKSCIISAWNENYRDKVYGLPLGSIAQMLADQGYKCAICSTDINESAAVDHDHSCCSELPACGSCVRGMLCALCNTYLGYVNDSELVFESGIKYLKKGKRVGKGTRT